MGLSLFILFACYLPHFSPLSSDAYYLQLFFPLSLFLLLFTNTLLSTVFIFITLKLLHYTFLPNFVFNFHDTFSRPLPLI